MINWRGLLCLTSFVSLLACGSSEKASDKAADEEGKSPVNSPIVGGVSSVKMNGPIEYGQEIDYGYESEYMGYTFSGVAGAKIRLTLLSDVNSGTDTLLFLYGPGSADNAWGHLIQVNDDGAGDLFAKIEVKLPSDGEFLVVASLYKYSTLEDRAFSLQLDCLSDSCVGTKPAENAPSR